jgi:hypothetical protein
MIWRADCTMKCRALPFLTRCKSACLAGGQAKEEGLHIVEELLAELSRRPEVAGAYIICPFNRYELALTVLDAVELPM